MGKQVRIISISFMEDREAPMKENPWAIRSLEQMEAYIRSAATPGGQDLILLPEFWAGPSEIQALDGQITTRMQELAREFDTYIVSPLSRKSDDVLKLNSAVVIDRHGEIMGCYDKNYPYWEEFDIPPAPMPGTGTPVFDADFGRFGIAICFDANFPHIWEEYRKQHCDLVLWPSAYCAGTQLQAHALNNNYCIVTATSAGSCLVYDLDGENLVDKRNESPNITQITLDLDRCIFHYNFNMDKLEKLLADHGDDVEVEKDLGMELWFILHAKKPGVSARELAAEYGLTDLQTYKNESLRKIDYYRENGCFPE